MGLNGDQRDPRLKPNAIVPTLVYDGTSSPNLRSSWTIAATVFSVLPLLPREPVDGTRANWFKKLMDEYVHPARIVRRRDNVN